MSNPTSNFNWQMPTNTDLVTDLPADFEVFGQAVDTTMADLKGGTTGQILSKATNADMDFTWIANDQGDITAVNVTSPITGGGTSGAVTVGIQSASTSQSGAVQLSDSTSTTSSVLAATPTAVKSAYDLANAAIPKSTVTAKGSIVAATASSTPSNLAVGNNGETLVADSSTATGLSYQANWAAGKNKIINGDFRINQRSFTSTTTSATYGFDRWTTFIAGDGTCTYSAQTFTAGAAPVAGYEAINYARLLTASQTTTAVASRLEQPIEDVRTYANQTVTISFWAKAASATPKIAVEMTQGFGSGGSTSVNTYAGQVTLSTSWARYSVSVAIPSISGKTIGTGSSLITRLYVSAGSDFNARTGSIGIQNNTFDIWGVQVEAGSVATAFQTATGTLAGELAACQRYYTRYTSGNLYGIMGSGIASNTGSLQVFFPFSVPMRTIPTALDSSAVGTFYWEGGSSSGNTPTNVTIGGSISASVGQALVNKTTGFTTGAAYALYGYNTTTAYVGFSAEL